MNSLLLELVQVNYLADCSLEILDDPSCVALVEVSPFFFKVDVFLLSGNVGFRLCTAFHIFFFTQISTNHDH